MDSSIYWLIVAALLYFIRVLHRKINSKIYLVNTLISLGLHFVNNKNKAVIIEKQA